MKPKNASQHCVALHPIKFVFKSGKFPSAGHSEPESKCGGGR